MIKRYPRRYRFDLFWRRIRRKIKRLLTYSSIESFSLIKKENDLNNEFNLLLNKESVPWSSPNIWREVEKFYLEISEPKVFEYGTGASSISHVNNLLKSNGTYIGIENDPQWFWTVTCALIRKLSDNEKKITINIEEYDHQHLRGVDINISSPGVHVILKLRENKQDYINSLEDFCDVVIIDGAHRKNCIQRVLQTDYLKIGGLIVLMEAGRGSPDWWEGDLVGEIDYTEEVNDLLKLGGKLLDGDGIDKWPNIRRRSPVPVSYLYPMEACLLIRPETISHKRVNN